MRNPIESEGGTRPNLYDRLGVLTPTELLLFNRPYNSLGRGVGRHFITGHAARQVKLLFKNSEKFPEQEVEEFLNKRFLSISDLNPEQAETFEELQTLGPRYTLDQALRTIRVGYRMSNDPELWEKVKKNANIY